MTITDDRTADTLGLLHAVDGQPYDYGGAGSAGRSYDCSGIDCAVVRCMLGDNPPQGFHDFSTESWRLAEPAGVGPYGMRPGLGPQGTAVQLVFHHGGGGPDSHTEGFLWGKRFGSNGSHGVFYDDPSRETRIGYFDATPWYLPNELIGSHGNPDLSGRGGAAPSPAPTGGTVSTNPNAVLFGVDISNHQQNIDIDQIAREGFTAIIAKASEGSDYIDPFFGRNQDGANRNGLLFWGYHYLRAGDPAGNAGCWDRAVGGDRSIACMIDWESGGGNLGDALAFKGEVEALGYRVPITYTGKWYWQQIGSPGGIDQLGALMDSCYGGNPTGFASGIYDGDGRNNWRAYGGATATILQFTDHAQVAGQTVDAWAYRGTRDQLAALLGGTPPATPTATPVLGGLVSDLTPDEQHEVLFALRDIRMQLCGSWKLGESPGWAQLGVVNGDGTPGGPRTIVDALGSLLNVPNPYSKQLEPAGQALGFLEQRTTGHTDYWGKQVMAALASNPAVSPDIKAAVLAQLATLSITLTPKAA